MKLTVLANVRFGLEADVIQWNALFLLMSTLGRKLTFLRQCNKFEA
jgi:hypothetical protein